MNIRIIAFTARGCELASRLRDGLSSQGDECEAFAKTSSRGCGLVPVEASVKDWTTNAFAECDALVFVGATGIAVRSVAPFLRSKTVDPAVVVIDERGRHAISLLSGHIGRGNELTLRASKIVGAEPVITTATDINGLFSADAFASRQGMAIDDISLVKDVSSALLEGRKVGMASDYPVIGRVPEELTVEEGDLGIHITSMETGSPFTRTLRLIPRNIIIGIGCRRGTSGARIAEKVFEAFRTRGLSFKGARMVASIDLKADEPGLLEFYQRYGLGARFFTAEELASVPDAGFSSSEFVASVAGVGNVCERAAMAASVHGRLIQGKMASDGVTVALAMDEFAVTFEEDAEND